MLLPVNVELETDSLPPWNPKPPPGSLVAVVTTWLSVNTTESTVNTSPVVA